MSRVESAAYAADRQKGLVTRIEAELSAYAELGLDSARSEDLISKWRNLVDSQPKLFINEDQSLNLEALQNFRRSQIPNITPILLKDIAEGISADILPGMQKMINYEINNR